MTNDQLCEWCNPYGSDRCSKNCMCSMQAGYTEAQIKQRTAYLSKAMVRPLKTSLHDRIVALAYVVNGARVCSGR